MKESPAKYGITNAPQKCVGRALFGEDVTPCASPDAYFFYHAGHPSTAVHKIVARKQMSEVVNAFPVTTNDFKPPSSASTDQQL